MVRHSGGRVVLGEYRSEIDEIYTHFAGSSSSALQIEGFLAFGAAFDLAPGYLSIECLEDVFEKAVTAAAASERVSSAHCTGRARVGMAPADFDEALCLLALAVSEKQWKVEYSAEKLARYQYKRKDAEKSRAEPALDEQIEHLFVALELHSPLVRRHLA